MEQQTNRHQDKFGTRLLKGLRGLTYFLLIIIVISVYYSGTRQVETGDNQRSTVTCSNGHTYTFAELGINASSYNPYTTQLYSWDNSRINAGCGSNGSATYSLSYDTSQSDPNAVWTALGILGVGALLIEVVYRFLGYVGGAKL